jgi:hypothetical protein
VPQGVRAELRQQLDALQLRPEGFVQYLTDALGFVLVRQLRKAGGGGGRGFDRPLYLLRKPG